MLTNPNLRIAFVSSSSEQPLSNVLQLTHDAGGEEQGHRDAVVEPAHELSLLTNQRGARGHVTSSPPITAHLNTRLSMVMASLFTMDLM